MSDERWPRIKALFQAAVEVPPDRREDFLVMATDGDDALQCEVRSLLAADAVDAGFLDRLPAGADTALDEMASPPPPARVGPYDVLELLGAGAMGEVYRARDTKLGRDVALKVLPAAFAVDPGRLARFRREAQILAALKHTNIAAIYGLEESNGVHALVLELVEGPTLADRIAAGPLPVGEAIAIGSQIASALGTAHEQNIIHRDLKPANIKVDVRGEVKVLDFGLAKSSIAPQLDDHSSREGLVIGTAAYMSPEQARGRPLDPRTDVWSFGCVLFEMLAGRAAFAAETVSDTIVRVLHGDADWDALPAAVPPRMRDLVRRCLEKDPDRRWSNISDARAELAAALISPATRTRASASPRTAVVAIAVMAVVALLGIATGVWRSASVSIGHPNAAVRHAQITFGGNVPDAALAPDGRSLAYVSDEGSARRLLVRNLSGGPPLELSKGPVFYPRWSPDGNQIAYGSVSGIHVVAKSGGQPRLIVPGRYVAWSPDGSNLAVASPEERGFRVVPLTGGEIRAVRLDGLHRLEDLDWDGHSNRLAISEFNDRESAWAIWISNADGTNLRKLHSDRLPMWSPRWSRRGDTVYVLRTQDSAELLGIAADGATTGPRVVLSGLQSGRRLTISADGERLLHTRELHYSNLWISGLGARGPAPRPVTHGTSQYWAPQVSPDGRWIVTAAGAGTRDSIARLPLHGGEVTPLTFGDLQADESPSWSPDGTRILFASDRGGSPALWMMNADGQDLRRLETSEVGSDRLVTWTPSGQVAWQQQIPGSHLNYRIRDLATGREEVLARDVSSGPIVRAEFSPRNDRIAVLWNRRDRPGLWTLTWPGRIERFLLGRPAMPLGWSPDGEWIFAFAPAGRQVLRISASTGRANVAVTFPSGRILSGDVTPDGRYVVCSISDYTSDAWLIEHFDRGAQTRER